MANTRSTMLTALTTELGALTEINVATQEIYEIDIAEKNAPYVGIVAGEEEKIIEDGTNICFILPVHLFVITEQKYTGIESLVDVVKNAVYSPTGVLTLTANVHDFNILATQPVELEHFDAGRFSSVQIDMTIRYYVTKASI